MSLSCHRHARSWHCINQFLARRHGEPRTVCFVCTKVCAQDASADGLLSPKARALRANSQNARTCGVGAGVAVRVSSAALDDACEGAATSAARESSDDSRVTVAAAAGEAAGPISRAFCSCTACCGRRGCCCCCGSCCCGSCRGIGDRASSDALLAVTAHPFVVTTHPERGEVRFGRARTLIRKSSWAVWMAASGEDNTHSCDRFPHLSCSWVFCTLREGRCDAGEVSCVLPGDHALAVELCTLCVGRDAAGIAAFREGTNRGRDAEPALDEFLDLPEGDVCLAVCAGSSITEASTTSPHCSNSC